MAIPIPDDDKDREVMRFIKRYTAENGWPPSVSEIADAIGVASKSSAHKRIERLVRQGHIRSGGKPRMIAVTESGRRLIEEGRAEL